MADYYNVLGVAASATEEQIRAAFRKQAKRCHPDGHAQGTPRQREDAQRRFIQLAQAYETLSHVGLRRVYDERLAAQAAAAAAQGKPGAGRPKAAPGAGAQAPPGTSDRQQRASQARRPSAEGERQQQEDEYRRATERRAEERQRQAEQSRRERERVQREAQDLASRQRRAHAAAEAARAKAHGRAGRERPLEDVVQDVEELLSRFGLDLRSPVEVVWDTLLTWARRIFRDTAPPEPTPRPKPRPPTEPHRRTQAPPQPPPRAKRRATFRDEAEDAVFRELHSEPSVDRRAEDLELERDLADLKRTVGNTPKGNRRASRAPTVEEELAALKERMGKE
jgi:curved DNA-binding protein CbpA